MPTRYHQRAASTFCLLLWCMTQADAAERYVTVYGAKYSDDKLGEVLLNKPITFEQSYIAVLAATRTLLQPQPSYQWELESQLGKHFDRQTHWELNAAFVLRWKAFPWNHLLRTSVALGDGLSYASEVPPLERASKTNEGAARLLNYVLAEVSFAPPQATRWSLVVRVHHRSGIFGAFGDVHGGSNHVGAGIKFHLTAPVTAPGASAQ